MCTVWDMRIYFPLYSGDKGAKGLPGVPGKKGKAGMLCILPCRMVKSVQLLIPELVCMEFHEILSHKEKRENRWDERKRLKIFCWTKWRDMCRDMTDSYEYTSIHKLWSPNSWAMFGIIKTNTQASSMHLNWILEESLLISKELSPLTVS